jgi:uncharacterized protein YaaR (DUF327 family)
MHFGNNPWKFERIGDVGGKATTLNNMAQVIAQQGDILRANRTVGTILKYKSDWRGRWLSRT